MSHFGCCLILGVSTCMSLESRARYYYASFLAVSQSVSNVVSNLEEKALSPALSGLRVLFGRLKNKILPRTLQEGASDEGFSAKSCIHAHSGTTQQGARTAARQQLDATENLRETNVELREENPIGQTQRPVQKASSIINTFCGGSMSALSFPKLPGCKRLD